VTYLAHAKLVERPRRAYIHITERGLAVLQDCFEKGLAGINIEYLSQYPEFVDFLEKSRKKSSKTKSSPVPRPHSPAPPTASAEDPPEESHAAAPEKIEDPLVQEVIERLRTAPDAFFEALIPRLLQAMGHEDGEREVQSDRRSEGPPPKEIIPRGKFGLKPIRTWLERLFRTK
jgi:restriction system protein